MNEKENKIEDSKEVAENIEISKEEKNIEGSDRVEQTETGHKEDNFDQLLEESYANIQNLNVGDKVSGEIVNITDSYLFISLGGKRDAYAEKSDYLDKKGYLAYDVGDTIRGYIVKYTDTETVISKSLISVNKRILKEAFEEKIPVNGKIRSMIKGGYLLDISGVRAFCPLSHIDNKLVADTKEYIGKNFDFQIIEYKENGRNIVASRRAILDKEKNKLRKDTLAALQVGDIIKGKVVRLTSFGVFVDIGGIEGLIHISKLSWVHVESPSEIVNIGDELETKVINIKGEKISLSLQAMQEDPFETVIKELSVGDVVNCRVLRNQPFGSFVEIRPGVEGLIPISELSFGRRISNPSEIVTEGDLVEAQIMKMDVQHKKISLSLKAAQPDPWDDIEDIITENDIITGKIENVANFGTFIKIKEGVEGLLPSSKMKLGGIKLDNSNIGEEMKVRVVKIDKERKRISLEPTNLPESAYEDKESWHKYKKQKMKKEEIVEENPFSVL